MQCCSRSTLGVIIGGTNVFFFTVLFVYVITIIYAVSGLSEEDIQENTDILTTSITLLYLILVICIISIINSVLLILGIVKSRHTLMKPWIFSAIVGMGFYILRLIIAIIVSLTVGSSFGTILAAMVVGLLTLGLQFLIFYPIYTLYTDIRDSASAQEQMGINNCTQNPPSYGEVEKGPELYN